MCGRIETWLRCAAGGSTSLAPLEACDQHRRITTRASIPGGQIAEPTRLPRRRRRTRPVRGRSCVRVRDDMRAFDLPRALAVAPSRCPSRDAHNSTESSAANTKQRVAGSHSRAADQIFRSRREHSAGNGRCSARAVIGELHDRAPGAIRACPPRRTSNLGRRRTAMSVDATTRLHPPAGRQSRLSS
jgi:hypothetical protein